MTDIASLAIEINTSDVSRAEQELDKLSATGKKAENSAKGVEQALSSAATGAASIGSAAGKANPAVNASAVVMKQAGLSAGQYSQAMRMLPMQLTDVVTSLASGMPAWQVAIQQGGQVRDSFGGIGNAARAVISAVGPLNLALAGAAAAAGAVFLAYHEGAQEMVRFSQALVLTGGYAGKTAGQLADLAREMDALDGVTQGSASAALTQVVASGQFTGEQIKLVAVAAEQMRVATGKAVEDTVAEFVKLGQDPVKTILDLNDKYHFLAQAQLEQIRTLKDQGREQAAATEAMKVYADMVAERAPQVTENLGWIERKWRDIKQVVQETIDGAKSIGRDHGDTERLTQIAQRLAYLRDTLNTGYESSGARDEIAKLTAEQDKLLAKQQLVAKQSTTTVDSKAETARQEARKQFDQVVLSNLSKEARLEREIADIRELGAKAGKSQAEIDTQVAAARDRYNESLSKGKAYQDDAATRMLQSLREQQASLVTQLSTTQKLTASEQELAKFAQLVADLKGKSILTAEQKSLLANQDQIRAQLQKNVALEQELKQREEITRQAQLQSALDEQLANRRNAVSISVAGVGMGDRARQDMEQINAIQQGYARQLTSLAAAQGTANGLSEADYQATVRKLRAAMDEEVAIYQDGAQQKLGAEQDLTKGATRAIENYRDNAQNIAGQVDGLFTNAFSSMEDAVAQFATTGKLSFSDFAKSVLADMARIEARRAASSLLSGIGSLAVSAVGSFFGGGSSAGSSAGDYTGAAMKNWVAAQAKGGGWSGGVQFFAKGGAFSNSVVTTPTAFGTASGLGVMGEAGPEAIMPLTRGRDGSLGVRASGGGATSLVINAPVTVKAQPGMGSQDASRQGAQIGQAMIAEVRKQISTELRPGGQIWRAMNGRG